MQQRLREAMLNQKEENKLKELLHPMTKLNIIKPALVVPLDSLSAINSAKVSLRVRSVSDHKLNKHKSTRTSLSKPIKQTNSISTFKQTAVKHGSATHSNIKTQKVQNQPISHFITSSQPKIKSLTQFKIKLSQPKKLFDQINFSDFLIQNTSLQFSDNLIVQNADYKRFVAYSTRHPYLQNSLQQIQQLLIRIRSGKYNNNKAKPESVSKISIFLPVKSLSLLKAKPSHYSMLSILEPSHQSLAIGVEYYQSANGSHKAALRIQTYYRMHRALIFIRRLRHLLDKIKVIQKHWRVSLLRRHTRRAILLAAEARLHKNMVLQQQLVNQWPLFHHVQVHIATAAVQDFKRISGLHKDNAQLSRVFTRACVVYVSAELLDEEIIRYYRRLLEQRALEVHFLCVENHPCFENISTLSKILYCTKTIKRIKQIVGKRKGYIVPGMPSIEYVNLSVALNLPIYAGPMQISKMLSLKSTDIFQSVFNKAMQKRNSQSKLPFQLLHKVHSIYTEKQLINSLAILIWKHPQVRIWYFKIQDQIEGRGLAYLNISKIAFLRQLSRSKQPIQQNIGLPLIAQQLKDKLQQRLKIMNKKVYPTYSAFISHFFTRGGVLESCPPHSVVTIGLGFHIDPLGDFQTVTTYQKWNGKIVIPSLLTINHEQLIRGLYKQLYLQRRMFGYFTAEYLAGKEDKQAPLKVYALSLDCHLTAAVSSTSLLKHLTNCSFNRDTNMLLDANSKPYVYFYCQGIDVSSPLSNLFAKCRFAQVQYHFEQRKGTIMLPIGNAIAFVVIQNSLSQLLEGMKKVCKVFQEMADTKQGHEQIRSIKGIIAVLSNKYIPKTIYNAKHISHLQQIDTK